MQPRVTDTVACVCIPHKQLALVNLHRKGRFSTLGIAFHCIAWHDALRPGSVGFQLEGHLQSPARCRCRLDLRLTLAEWAVAYRRCRDLVVAAACQQWGCVPEFPVSVLARRRDNKFCEAAATRTSRACQHSLRPCKAELLTSYSVSRQCSRARRRRNEPEGKDRASGPCLQPAVCSVHCNNLLLTYSLRL